MLETAILNSIRKQKTTHQANGPRLHFLPTNRTFPQRHCHFSDSTNLCSAMQCSASVYPLLPFLADWFASVLTCLFSLVSSSVSCWWAACPLVVCHLVLPMLSSTLLQHSVTAQKSWTQMRTSVFAQHSPFVLSCKSLRVQHLHIITCLHKASICIHRSHVWWVCICQRVCVVSLIQSPKEQSARSGNMGSFVLKRSCNFSIHSLVVPSLGMSPWFRMPWVERSIWVCDTLWRRGWSMGKFQNLVRQMLE